MATQLNIKDAATIELAHKLAQRDGKSITRTIREALERADGDRHDDARSRADAILAKVRAIPIEPCPAWRGRTSRDIIKDFHELEWQEQYGRDQWS